MIDTVEPDQVEGQIRLEKTGIRDSPPAEGGLLSGAPGELPEEMGPVDGFTVANNCDAEAATVVHELGLQVRRNGEGSATLGSIKIAYHVGEKAYVTMYPYTVILCDMTEANRPKQCG